MKKLLSLAYVVLLLAISSVPAQSAPAEYTVSVSKNRISFSRGGVVTGGYGIQSNDITLITIDSGDVLVCFYNTLGNYVGVTLGAQQRVGLIGNINTLTLHETLDRPVIVGSTGRVTSMTVNAPVKVSVWGKVDNLTVSDMATVVAATGSVISHAHLYDTRARLFANAGSSVDGYLADSTPNSQGLTLHTNTIYASYGDTLRDLRTALSDTVYAYDSDTHLRVPGQVDWVDDLSTPLLRSQNFTFRFTPESSTYKTVTGTVRVTVDESSYGVQLDIGAFRVNSSGGRLSSYLDDLEENVIAYNSSGRQIYGDVKWVVPSLQVRRTGWYEFIFIPYSSRYASVRGEIKILLGEDMQSDDVFESDLTLRISDIEVYSTNQRLRQLQKQLNLNVRAYDPQGKRVNGTFEWVDSPSTIVRSTGNYEFCFIPDDRNYGRVYSWIQIYVKE